MANGLKQVCLAFGGLKQVHQVSFLLFALRTPQEHPTLRKPFGTHDINGM